ncbi:2OG-Fe(II) oxygenase [Alteromonas sp. RKMC-009]|uniref:2OG-Fe(II) oxygenase n=1 Tax=Alteromonas sp. RKMC-009 TaxID=2267264 RepID=UPI000E6902DE|nr:2OG-Fe(II) oxygenase [Alteromonas sp. RKMC-009]AYA64151.1 2OG-Fe(II) oxygenase [Alteromonas sp. RKMC-009]
MTALLADDIPVDTSLFTRIADDIYSQGYSVQEYALPEALANALFLQNNAMSEAEFQAAGIGRSTDFQENSFVRRDEICWIDGSSAAGADWLSWTAQLKQFLNRNLMLGLYSFESHFAVYQPGAFYKRHLDAFKGQANRVLSLVTYLNPDWQEADGGQLVIYTSEEDKTGIRVLPKFGTVVVFLSEEFPHEVLPATRSRSSIAGWYRVNGTIGDVIDPPQ